MSEQFKWRFRKVFLKIRAAVKTSTMMKLKTLWLRLLHIIFRLRRALFFTLCILILSTLNHPGRFPQIYEHIKQEDIHLYLSGGTLSKKQPCTYEGFKVDIRAFLNKLKYRNFSLNGLEETWKARDCIPFKVAIVVPYRNRESQLRIFLQYMHWFLHRQLLDYHIYIVEQSDKMDFNRALLFNIGYIVAQKRSKSPCFIFHDIDLLPENLENIYTCTSCPRHMSSCVNTLRYTLLYGNLFGGAVAILSDQFELVNGFPNRYFGWGGEDDDMSLRVRSKNLTICRFSPLISRYTMLPHKHAVPNENRYNLLATGEANQATDGLSSISDKYKILSSEDSPRHTVLHVELL